MATDLGKEREAREYQRSELESNLTSMIGMGVALDPMADRLIMKSNARGNNTFRGGYSLVGDDEGEPEPIVNIMAPRLPSLGRGRGTTLPAWMTQKCDGPTGANSSIENDSEDDAPKKKRKKGHDKSKKSSHRGKRHRKDSSKSDRKRSRREYDESDISSRSDDASQSSRRHSDRKREARKSSRPKRDRRRSEDERKHQSQRRRTDSSESVQSDYDPGRERTRVWRYTKQH